MHPISDFLQTVLRGALRLLLMLAAAVFVLSVLVAAVIVMLGVGIWSLLGGRRPEPIKVFSQFRRASSRFTPGGWSDAGDGGRGRSDPLVVDVQAREVDQNADTRDAPGPTDQASR